MYKFNPFTSTFEFLKGLIKTADIEDGAITNAKISAVAAIAASKLNLSVITPASDSTTAFQFQNAAGTQNLLTLDSINRVAILPGGVAIARPGGVYIGDSRTIYPAGSNWTALGVRAANSATGNGYSAFGQDAGASNTTGQNWIAFGKESGQFNVSGSFWIAIGRQAAYQNTSGGNFVAIGEGAASATGTASSFVSIGNGAGSSDTRSNVLHLANSASKSLLCGLFNSDCLAIGHTTQNPIPTAAADLAASTLGRASLRIRAGVAPSSPQEGDIWNDGTNLRIRINGATRTFMLV